MNDLRLTPRLKCVAECLNPCRLLADIGTDHAYIPIYAVKNKIADHAIASDVVKGPLEIARDNVSKNGLLDDIDVVLADGISASGGADTAVIAGMGGTLICKILSDNIKIAHSIKTLVLQPMTCNFELRKFLHKNGFKIVSEKLAKEENKIYNIMVVTSGEQHFDDEFYYYIGKALFDLKDSLLPEYLKHRANVIKRQIGGMKKSKNPEIIKKSKKLQKLYVRFNKEIAYYDKSK